MINTVVRMPIFFSVDIVAEGAEMSTQALTNPSSSAAHREWSFAICSQLLVSTGWCALNNSSSVWFAGCVVTVVLLWSLFVSLRCMYLRMSSLHLVLGRPVLRLALICGSSVGSHWEASVVHVGSVLVASL